MTISSVKPDFPGL